MNKGRQRGTYFWVPINEELPKEPGVYNVTIEYEYCVKDVHTSQRSTVARWHPGSGFELLDYALCANPFCINKRILAWTYLPSLYIPKHDEGGSKDESQRNA